MHREVIAIVVCMLAQAASAEVTCVAPAAQVATAQPAAVAAKAAQQPPARAELIKTAAAGTRDDAPPQAAARSGVNDPQDLPRRGSTAMLLAARALMSGIALRRYGARGL